MTDERAAEEFADRVIHMIQVLALPMREVAIIRHSLRYAYLQGYRDCDALWTWQQIAQKGS